MSTGGLLDSVERLDAAVDDFTEVVARVGFDGLDDGDFLDLLREVEAMRRRLAAVDHMIVAAIDRRELPELRLARTAAGVLQEVWRLSPREARARVGEAEALGERMTLTGEPLAPLRPIIAAARRAGELSAEQVSVLLRALDRLPRDLAVAEVDGYEQILVDAARALAPRDLARIGQRIADTVNPDGVVAPDEEQQRRRFLTLATEHDGMVSVRGLLDAPTGARALAVFGAMSEPMPDDATGRDERTAAQRRHDALGELLLLAQRAGDFATRTANPSAVHVVMTAEQYATATGHATTSYGQPIRVDEALRLADQAAIAWLVHDGRGSVLHHGRNRRFASADQVIALIARDGGCSFPGCDIPPEWCERHHVVAWQHGGRTDLDNLVLLCRYHHAKHLQQGWEIAMPAGVPEFIPPPYIDPRRRPIRGGRFGLAARPVSSGGS